jgi:thiamine pyrophosphate-dependent acetolactate synthase large subunit-like protein
VAEILGAGVAKALLDKAVLRDTLPYVTGAIGMLGTKPSWQMMQRCDTLFTIGSNLPYSEFLLNNRDLRYVTWEQRAMAGDIRFEASQDLPDVEYAEWGKLLGLGGIRVERPEDVAPAWTEAFRADRPFVLETIIDTNVPPLPPHVTLEQATAITRAVFKGDPDRAAIIRQSFRDLIEDFVPHPGR